MLEPLRFDCNKIGCEESIKNFFGKMCLVLETVYISLKHATRQHASEIPLLPSFLYLINEDQSLASFCVLAKINRYDP